MNIPQNSTGNRERPDKAWLKAKEGSIPSCGTKYIPNDSASDEDCLLSSYDRKIKPGAAPGLGAKFIPGWCNGSHV